MPPALANTWTVTVQLHSHEHLHASNHLAIQIWGDLWMGTKLPFTWTLLYWPENTVTIFGGSTVPFGQSPALLFVHCSLIPWWEDFDGLDNSSIPLHAQGCSLSSQKHTKEQNTDLDLQACTHRSSSPSHELCYWHWSYIVIFSNWTIYVTKDSLCLERVLMWATVCQSLVLISLLITQGGENVVNIQTSEIY